MKRELAIIRNEIGIQMDEDRKTQLEKEFKLLHKDKIRGLEINQALRKKSPQQIQEKLLEDKKRH